MYRSLLDDDDEEEEEEEEFDGKFIQSGIGVVNDGGFDGSSETQSVGNINGHDKDVDIEDAQVWQ
jgi:hypothetical protein